MNTIELVRTIWPIILIQLALQIYCIYDVIKKGKARYLSVPIWVIIIALGEIFGAIVYLLLGRSED